MALISSIESVVSIVLLIVLGFFLRKKGWFSDSFGGNISKFIMNIALPASIFVSVLSHLTKDKLLSLSGGLLYGGISVALGYVIALALAKILKIRNGRRGTFVNMFVNANTIFIGLPLNVALFGEDSIPYFLVCYVLNTISTWAIGVFLISADPMDKNSQAKKEKFNWKKLLPAPLIGFLVALVFLFAEIPVPGFIHSPLTYLGNTVTPLSLIYIGIVLCNAGLKSIHFDRDTIAGLVCKFVLAPALITGLILIGRGWMPLPLLEEKTLIIQAAVPALAVLPILVNEAKGDVAYATNLVTTSTVLFIVIIPVVEMLLGYL
ncbi:MAG: AEC family transporter [Capnocytophaga sp.]|nr:AEC family transporter [Capnocytophaga sp.]